MRRLFITLLISALGVAAMLAGAHSEVLENAFSQDNALYVYRNDGEFNAFLREDIKKICLSRINVDSVEHKEFVVQEFHTPDSIFRISLEVIDSVSFVQPKTILSPKVVVLTKDHLPYLDEITSHSITFSNDTPQKLLPHVGDVLVSEVYEGILEKGFAGVIDYEYGGDFKSYSYKAATLDDIFDQIVFTTKSETSSSDDEVWEFDQDGQEDENGDHSSYASSRVQTFAKGKVKTKIPTIRSSVGVFSLEARPTVTVWATMKKDPNIKTRIQMIMAIESDITAKIEATQEDAYENEYWLGDRISIRTPVPCLNAFLKAGLFFENNTNITASITSQGHFYRKFGFVVDDEFRQIDLTRASIEKPEMELVISGEIKAGVCLRAGMEFLSEKMASAYLTCYAGLYAESELRFDDDDSDGFKFALNDESSMEIGAYICGEPGFTVMTEDIRFDKSENDWLGALEKKFTFKKGYALPKFSDLKVKTGKDCIIAQASVERDLFWPVKVGMGIRKRWQDDYSQVKWVEPSYLREEDWSGDKLKVEFTGLRPMEIYNAFPMVELFGTVFADTNDDEITVPAEVITGEAKDITSSSVVLYGSTPSNVNFDEWQCEGFYISEYPSCDHESESIICYTTDQAGPEFSVTVDGLDADTKYYYKAFIGNNDMFFGEVRSFKTEEGEEEAPCEAVDLGLSVLWGSANLGTSDCLEPGDFYAWGETHTKYDYTPENCTTISENLGNIKGTNYDPVHRQYHGKWRMPTKAEFEELLNHCTIEAEKIEYLENVWDEKTGNIIVTQTQKDVVLVKAPNGNAIVLPYTGAYDGSQKIYDDQIFYWTATPEMNAENDKAYEFWVDYFARNISIDAVSRHFGLPIRPVRDRD